MFNHPERKFVVFWTRQGQDADFERVILIGDLYRARRDFCAVGVQSSIRPSAAGVGSDNVRKVNASQHIGDGGPYVCPDIETITHIRLIPSARRITPHCPMFISSTSAGFPGP